ncbi:hypothetical protein OJ997_28075 [Solirubrobacter phytolaccae]|uniref:Uncharacterized protein n=1 Tax=Solirubrobacter phytolaccae TaxID=1404360 RepID=A0A9X3NDN8_9ACTN|nr:hypothetical protein [Solirubrobacter phytolaccae]MDA0184199.1 hypothetical protein [Solirubrobacter phytolaccae]
MAAFAVSASDALAQTQYAGSATVSKGRIAVPLISLTVQPDGNVVGRLAYNVRCRKTNFPTMTTRLTGRVNGATFTVTGRSRLGSGLGTLRFTLTGTLAPDSATGQVRLRGCHKYTRTFALRTPSAPAGAPALPAPSVPVFGFTSQSAGGVSLPLALRVAANGRFYGSWASTMRCGNRTLAWNNATPVTSVRADGSFVRNERFTVRYDDGSSERYRVNFSGRFLADGVSGTLRVRMRYREGRNTNFEPCDSGVVTWAARP